MTRRINRRCVDAASATVESNAVSHDLKIFFPMISFIISQYHFAPAWAMHLYVGIALVLFDRGLAAEDQAATTSRHDRSTNIITSRIKANRLLRDASLKKSAGH